MVWGEVALTNMLGFREHNRRLRDGPRRSYDVPLSDGRPGALIPLQRERSGPGIMYCGTCRAPMASCSHRDRGLNPRWRRRYGSPRPDGLPMGRDRRQGCYPDDRPYNSPFHHPGRLQHQEYFDEEDYSDDSLDDNADAYHDSDYLDPRAQRLFEALNGRGGDESRRPSYHRERERSQYPSQHYYNHAGRPSEFYNRRNNSYDEGMMYGQGGRNRGHHTMYAPGEHESMLSYWFWWRGIR